MDIDVGPTLFSIQLWLVNNCFLKVFSLIIWGSDAISFCFCLATEFSYLFLNSHYSSFFDHILLEFCYDTFLQRWFYKCNFFFIQVLFVARLHCKDSLEVLVLSDLNISALHTTDNQLWVKISRETVTYMVLTLQTWICHPLSPRLVPWCPCKERKLGAAVSVWCPVTYKGYMCSEEEMSSSFTAGFSAAVQGSGASGTRVSLTYIIIWYYQTTSAHSPMNPW